MDTKKLEQKQEFYKSAYTETSRELNKNRNTLEYNESLFKKHSFNFIDSFLGESLEDDEKSLIQDYLGFNLIELDNKFSKKQDNLENNINNLKNTPKYIEYLKLSVDKSSEYIFEMEKDETFKYLLEQNFHNEKFINEPQINIFGFLYQPRYWKFNKIATKKAIEFGFESNSKMFDAWKSLRILFKSFSENETIEEVLKECKNIRIEIENIQKEIDILPKEYLLELKYELSEFFKIIEDSKLDKFSEKEEIKLIISLKKTINEIKSLISSSTERLNVIVDNLNIVEQLLDAVDSEMLELDEITMKVFYENNNPNIPIYEIIPKEEWKILVEGFKIIGVTLGSKERYSKVKKELSSKEQERLLNKYGVKEGEIFYAETEDRIKTSL